MMIQSITYERIKRLEKRLGPDAIFDTTTENDPSKSVMG